MSILVDTVRSAVFQHGFIVVSMKSAIEIRVPVAGNLRLCDGTPQQLSPIEVSPFGLHWPDLDEDLSFRGLLSGDYGQTRSRETDGCGMPPATSH